jgi:hypothetical protein
VFRNITHDMASQAYAHMNAAQEQFHKADRELQKKGIYPLLSLINTSLFLEELEKNSFELNTTVHEFNQKSPLKLQFRLLKATFTKSL